MAQTLEDFLVSINTISESLNKNVLITTARDSWVKSLDNVEMSTEEKDLRLASYNEQISLGVVAQAISLASSFPLLNADLKIKEEQGKKEKLAALTHLAGLKKNFGYKDATDEGLNNSSDDGVVDAQIKGFSKDMAYKASKMFSEQSGMLAQNDIATPKWMADVMKISTEIMTDGKIDIETATDAGTGDETTTVTYNNSNVLPDGLDN